VPATVHGVDVRLEDRAPEVAIRRRTPAACHDVASILSRTRCTRPGPRVAPASIVSSARGKLGSMVIERDPNVPTPPPGQDALPYDDGEPMESKRHRVQMNLLIDTLDEHWRDRDDVYVSGNMFVYFSELQTKGAHFRGPDVFVVLDTIKKSRKSWVAWEEGGRLPNVVIELLSASTEAIDRGEKMRVYSRVWRTGEYFLYDPFSHVLEGYSLDPRRGEYDSIAPDSRGNLPVAQLGLALGLQPGDRYEEPGPFLRWFDGEGRLLPEGREQVDSGRVERERADALARRVAELEDALRSRR
jgi:Uma2 family endonuclease